MKYLFEQGYLEEYSHVRLNEAGETVPKNERFEPSKTTVFISHKHDDIEDFKGLLGFLEKQFFVKAYIDSRDSSMPYFTSGKTAIKIREKIKACDKFIFLATNGAIESKWCNWELGYGDANKFEENIALFQMKPANTMDSDYKGSEYMSIYPYIVYYDGTETYGNGKLISKGYYVMRQSDKGKIITPLSYWFKQI